MEVDDPEEAGIVSCMTTLIAGEPLFVYPLLHVDFTDTETGATYSVQMDADGAFIHEHGKRFEADLQNWTETALHANGRPIHEDWKDRLTVKNARHG